jgi:hypothetical protein
MKNWLLIYIIVILTMILILTNLGWYAWYQVNMFKGCNKILTGVETVNIK